jgi:hypothetical protein
VRLFLLIASLGATLAAQDPREIVHKAIEADARNAERQHDYTYLMREETRELDSAEKAKRTTIHTVEITMIDGSPYRRLVARNDQPIPAEEQKVEEEKLRFNASERTKESAAERQRRIAEFRRREERRREPLREVADAYNFKLIGEETLNGAACWVIDAIPRPGFKPKSSTSAVLTVLVGRLWISKDDHGWAKTEMEAQDAFTLGGFLLRLSKGSRIAIEQTPVGDGVWLPKFLELKFAARVLLVKSLREDMKFNFIDYRKSLQPAAISAER